MLRQLKTWIEQEMCDHDYIVMYRTVYKADGRLYLTEKCKCKLCGKITRTEISCEENEIGAAGK